MAYTENGWPGCPATDDVLNWVTVPGTNPPVRLQIQKGQPTQILRAFAADFSKYVEPLENHDTACYTHDNSVWNSNHRSGTALDLNWDKHPFHVSYAGFDDDKRARMRDLLAFYTYDGLPLVYWGQDWGLQGIGPFDPMHIQLNCGTYNNPKTERFIKERIRPDGFSTYRRDSAPASAVAATVTEKSLNWDTSITSQEKPWSCGPATTQILLSIRGISVSEDELIRVVGATVNGTDAITQIELRALDHYLPEAQYTTVWLPHDPPSEAQRDEFWEHLRAAIDNGYGVAMNWVSPPNNPPRPVHGSTAVPGFYGRSTIYHYIAAVAYAQEGSERFVGIGDPGGAPNRYWVTLDQCAGLMTPKGYCYPAAFKPSTAPVAAPAQPQPTAVLAARSGYKSISPYRTPGEAAIGGLDVFQISDDGMLHGVWVEYSAMVLGDQESIARVVRSAAGHGADTSPAFVKRARRALSKVPREDLAAVLQRVAVINPEWIDALRSGQ